MTTNTFASTNRSNFRLIPEVTGQWGSTPTTGVTREVLVTSHTMTVKKNTTKSNNIRDDRMTQDIIQTEMMSDGGINIEFAAGATDDLLQAFLQGTWTRPMTQDFWRGSAVSWTATNAISVVGPDISGFLTIGRRMKTDGFFKPNNNGFWQISSFSYASGATTIVFAASTATVEAGNIKSTVSDANDVIVLKSTAIRAGTSGVSSFDSNSGNAFASAIAAGQLVVGQKIHVEGLGYETGTITYAAVAVAGSSVSVSDNTNVYTFVAGTDFAVGVSATASATNLAAAINAARVTGAGPSGTAPTLLNVRAVSSVGAVTITNLNATGGALVEVSDVAANITVVNFTGGDASQHGVFTVTALTSDSVFVSPTPTTNANAGSLPITIRGSMLRNPSASANIIPQSYTIETFYQDVSHGFIQDGMMPNSFSLDANASSVLNGTYEFMGRATSTLNATKLGASPYTVLTPVTNEVMNATTDVGSVLKNGTALTTAVKQIKIDGKAQLRNQMGISSKFPVGIGTGRFELTGSLQAYFTNLDLFNDFLNHNTVSLAWNFFDSRLVSYYYTIPAIKVSADPIKSGGIDQDVMEDINFEAFRDPITQCMIQIDRFSSLSAV